MTSDPTVTPLDGLVALWRVLAFLGVLLVLVLALDCHSRRQGRR